MQENPYEFLAEHHDPKVTAISGVTTTNKQTNLANDPQHAPKLAEMRALLLSEMRRHNDPWRFSHQPNDGLMPPQGEKSRKTKNNNS